MARKAEWDFNCPQYVDFLAGVDNDANDIYFDCGDNFSPSDERACENLPASVKTLTEEDENKLINKMTAALSVIENTPKLKRTVKSEKLYLEQTPGMNVDTQLFKPVVKFSTALRPSARKVNKSVCEVNRAHIDKPLKAKEFKLVRSSSLNDLKTIKKHTYPRTPLCLKRTINAKNKVLKTTEEMELEQIAELQKQLAQHLRNNEISYRKLKQRQKPCVQKNTENKPENPKGNADTNTDKNIRQNVHAATKQEAMKLDSIIDNKGSSFKVPKNFCKDILETSKNLSVSSSIKSEECAKSKDHSSKKHIKYRLHSGLVFHGIVKKNTVVKPFSFEDKIKEMKSQKAVISLTKSVSKDNVDNGKENIPITKSKSAVMKLTGVKNVRSDMKLVGSNKIIGQCKGNPVRGLPLAENTIRN